jgi:hypothetical protein
VAAHAEEPKRVGVDPGNDPGRDEYGLPPVDIQIPDDARDLDRDVHAYYRELRARRRRTRVQRFAGPLTRHGMVLPLVAACLALTLLTGTLLTVLAGRQVSPLPGRGGSGSGRGAPGPGRRTPGPAQSAPASASPGPELLPNAQLAHLDGRPVGLRSLAPAVLAWVPSGCQTCGSVLRQLARRATQAHVRIYFVGTDRAVQDLEGLIGPAGPRYSQKILNDTTGVLIYTYGPVGVTAIFAHRDDSVNVVRQLPSQPALKQFASGLHALAVSDQGSPAASATPSGTPVPHAT